MEFLLCQDGDVRESKPSSKTGSVIKNVCDFRGSTVAWLSPLSPLLSTQASFQVTLAMGDVTALPVVHSRTPVSQESELETQSAMAKHNHGKKAIGKGSTVDESPSPSSAMT